MGNGHDVSAVFCSAEVAQKLDGGVFSTFGGNPLACAAARATIDAIYNERMIDGARSVGKILADNLKVSWPIYK